MAAAGERRQHDLRSFGCCPPPVSSPALPAETGPNSTPRTCPCSRPASSALERPPPAPPPAPAAEAEAEAAAARSCTGRMAANF